MLTAHANRVCGIQFSSPTLQVPGMEFRLAGLAASADLLNHLTSPTFKFSKEGPVLQRLYSLLGQSQMATMVVNLFLQHAFTWGHFSQSYLILSQGSQLGRHCCLRFIFYQVAPLK